MVMFERERPRARLNMLGIHAKPQEATLKDYVVVLGANFAFCTVAALVVYGFVRGLLAFNN